MKPSEVSSAILHILNRGPKPRPFIEATLVYEYNVEPKQVTTALRKLRSTREVRCSSFNLGFNGAPTHVYHLCDLSEHEERFLMNRLLLHREVFNAQAMRHAGECYVRSLAIRSGAFVRVPQRRRLGNISCDMGRLTADLILKRKSAACAIREIIVEVKNCRESIYPSADAFRILLQKAIAVDMLPMLVAAHVSAEALKFCRDVGIVVLALDRQLLPKSRRRAVEGLRPMIGPVPIEYVGKGRFYQNEKVLPAQAMRDLATMGSGAIFEDAEVRWLQNRSMVTSVPLASWKDARRMIGAHLASRQASTKLGGPSI